MPSALLQIGDPIPQGLQIFIVDGQFPNALIKLDGMPQANFRILEAACDTRVAGQFERD